MNNLLLVSSPSHEAWPAVIESVSLALFTTFRPVKPDITTAENDTDAPISINRIVIIELTIT